MSENEQEYYAVKAQNPFWNTEPKSTFYELKPGTVFTLGVGNMAGENSKPGERCLLNKMFICRRINTLADATMSSIHGFAFYGRKVKPWTRFFVRAAIWIALGPKRYKEPNSYEVEYVGKEMET